VRISCFALLVENNYFEIAACDERPLRSRTYRQSRPKQKSYAATEQTIQGVVASSQQPANTIFAASQRDLYPIRLLPPALRQSRSPVGGQANRPASQQPSKSPTKPRVSQKAECGVGSFLAERWW